MGLQIRCYIEGEQKVLDLYGDENVTINYSFAEIQDIRKKNSAYTQEFKIPGSKNNNLIFNYFYDINSVYLDFNPKKKFEADLIYDGYELYNGYIRMNSVTINKLEKIYSVTFYNAIGDLASNIGDKALCNIDTTELNTGPDDIFLTDPSLQSLTGFYEVISPQYLNWLVTNFGPPNALEKGDLNYTIAQRGYDYTGTSTGTIIDIDTGSTPILTFSGVPGFFDNQFTPVQSVYLMPNVRIKKLYEMIVSQAGYNIESDFFDTDYFKRYYLPLSFNTEQPYMAQAADFYFSFNNLSGETGSTNFTVDEVFGAVTTYQILRPKEIISSNLGYNPVDPNYDNGIGEYLIEVPGNNNKAYFFELITEYTGTTAGPGNTSSYGDIKLYNYAGYDVSTNTVFGYLVNSTQLIAYDDDNGGSSTQYQNFLSGSFGQYTTYPVGNYFFFAFDSLVPNPITITTMNGVISGNSVNLPSTIELNKEMSCDKKQVEFISDINRMFNFVVIDHPYKPNTLIIEPIVNYIGKGELLDWTTKVDYDSPQTLFPTTTLINGSIFTANLLDKDFINSEFNRRSNLIFGQQIIDLGDDYKNDTIDLTQKLGQNTDYYLNASGQTNVALSCFFITREVNNNGISSFEYRPFRSLPRVSFLGVPIPSGNTGQPWIGFRYGATSYPWTNNGFEPIGESINVNRLTTYPFGISGFSHYTTYNSTDTFTPDELIYPLLETQYDRYYYDYIDDLISPENKVYSCKMYLTPWDVAQLYGNETILIKNAKFRINKIQNLSLIEPNICDVELVKLTKDYTPTPTLFYDLVSCDNPCNVIHTHTDLIFPIFAYEGKFVDIVTGSTTSVPFELLVGRFKVIKSQYNPNFNYTTPYFKIHQVIDGTIPLDYEVTFRATMYDSCTGSTKSYTLDIYDDTSASYTALTLCQSFTVTNTGATSSTVTYTDCNNLPQTIVIPPSVTNTFCALTGSIIGNTLQICYGGDCPPPYPSPTPTIAVTPTPTPSVTVGLTPTQTPSPTSTPLSCICIEYDFYNPEEFSVQVDYIDCYGNLVVVYLSPSELFNVCACQDTPASTWAQITEVGNCSPLPSQTPTPSITPSPTSSPFCDCREYLVENQNDNTAYIQYISCVGNPTTYQLDPFESTTICMCFGTFIPDPGVTVFQLGPC